MFWAIKYKLYVMHLAYPIEFAQFVHSEQEPDASAIAGLIKKHLCNSKQEIPFGLGDFADNGHSAACLIPDATDFVGCHVDVERASPSGGRSRIVQYDGPVISGQFVPRQSFK